MGKVVAPPPQEPASARATRRRRPRTEYPPADQVELGTYEFSTHLLALEVLRRGFDVTWVNRSFFTFPNGDRTLGFWCTRSTVTSTVGAKAAVRKDMAARLLRGAGVAVARGRGYRSDRFDAALRYVQELGFPLVVKPTDGTKGRGVSAGVQTLEEFELAWAYAGETGSKRIRVERFFSGTEARFLVVGDRCVAVAKRIPPNVTGNGRDPIRRLVETKNEQRRENPHLRNRQISIGAHRETFLRRQGLSLDSVVPDGTRVYLDSQGNMSAGADSVDMTDDVHTDFKEIAIRSAKAFPGLGVAGVDIIARQFDGPAAPRSHIVCEVNSMPALGAHHYPMIGTPRDAARDIVDHVLTK